MAAVPRALHSVGVVAGPKGGPGRQNIPFHNEKCYVAALGVARKLMETLISVAEYDREGNLHMGEFSLRCLHRQGADQWQQVRQPSQARQLRPRPRNHGRRSQI